MYVCAVAAWAGLSLGVANNVVPRAIVSSTTTIPNDTTGLVNRCILSPFRRCLRSMYPLVMPRPQKYDHLNRLWRPLRLIQGRKQAVLSWGLGGVAPLALGFRLLSHHPGAECHPGQDSTCLNLCSLRQSLVGMVVV